MRRVIIESPYAGDVEENMAYLQHAIRDCIARGEAPFASHQMYTRALNDLDPRERAAGMMAGFMWGRLADACVVYMDRGISEGMRRGIAHATAANLPVEYRSLA